MKAKLNRNRQIMVTLVQTTVGSSCLSDIKEGSDIDSAGNVDTEEASGNSDRLRSEDHLEKLERNLNRNIDMFIHELAKLFWPLRNY